MNLSSAEALRLCYIAGRIRSDDWDRMMPQIPLRSGAFMVLRVRRPPWLFVWPNWLEELFVITVLIFSTSQHLYCTTLLSSSSPSQKLQSRLGVVARHVDTHTRVLDDVLVAGGDPYPHAGEVRAERMRLLSHDSIIRASVETCTLSIPRVGVLRRTCNNAQYSVSRCILHLHCQPSNILQIHTFKLHIEHSPRIYRVCFPFMVNIRMKCVRSC
ncbi:hypothetical protein B0H21DRAFT_760576, partial [Amylocystis lapponica]